MIRKNITAQVLSLTLLAGCVGLKTPNGSSTTNGLSTPTNTTASPGENSNLATTLGGLDRLGIAGAKSLFVVSGLTAASPYRIQSASTPTLYEEQASGSIVPVPAMDASGSAVPPPQVSQVATVNSSFIYLAANPSATSSYLVRSADGKVAQLPGQAPVPVSDSAGNMYYTEGGGLWKISSPAATVQDLAATNSLVATELNNPSLDPLTGNPIVDPAGDVMVGDHIYKASGGVVETGVTPFTTTDSSGTHTYTPAWLGLDGNFYASYGEGGTYRINLDNGFTKTFIAHVDVSSPNPPVKVGNELVWFGGGLLMVQDSSGNMYVAMSSQQVTQLTASADTLYALAADSNGTQILESFSTASLTPVTEGATVSTSLAFYPPKPTTVFQDPNYQILHLAVSSDNTITVSALRLSDNTYVVGTIANGSLTVTSSTIPQVQEILPLQ